MSDEAIRCPQDYENVQSGDYLVWECEFTGQRFIFQITESDKHEQRQHIVKAKFITKPTFYMDMTYVQKHLKPCNGIEIAKLKLMLEEVSDMKNESKGKKLS